MIDWGAIAAAAAIGALALAAVQAIASGLRSTVVYEAKILKCELVSLKSLYALKLQIKNTSFRHITDMNLQIDMARKPIGFTIAKTGTINEKLVTTDFQNGQFIIKIPEFPKFEEIEIDIFADCFLSSFKPLKGGNKIFVLKSRSDLTHIWLIWFIALSTFLIYFIAWRSSYA